jgi:hypothetical protein
MKADRLEAYYSFLRLFCLMTTLAMRFLLSFLGAYPPAGVDQCDDVQAGLSLLPFSLHIYICNASSI